MTKFTSNEIADELRKRKELYGAKPAPAGLRTGTHECIHCKQLFNAAIGPGWTGMCPDCISAG